MLGLTEIVSRLGSSMVVSQDSEVATSVGDPGTNLSASASSMARLEGGDEEVGVIATCTGK